MKLGAIIVTYNRLELLKECIDACLKQTCSFDKIFVINNASTDGTYEYLNELKEEKIEVINSVENLGGAGGFYLGVEKAKEADLDYVLLIDDDAILDEKYNEEIHNNMVIKAEGICGYSGTVMTNNEIQYEHRRHFKKGFKCFDSKKEEYDKEYFDYELSTFCGLYVPVALIYKIGLPRKDFFIWYDDTEYSLRLGEYGKIRNVNKAFLNHKTNIANNGSGFNWKSYYGIRNQLVIIKQYFSKMVLLKNIIYIRFMILAGKIMKIVKHKKYYGEVADIYSTALNDALNNNLGMSSKYFPGYKINKED